MRTFVIGDVHGRRAQLDALVEMLPRDKNSDTLVFLGDLIDRGLDAPGVVEEVLRLKAEAPDSVQCLRGNHEQMLLDFIDKGIGLWLSPATGGDRTFEQYTNSEMSITSIDDFESARELMRKALPVEHLELFRSTLLFYEDKMALYVHAGLEDGKHPKETDTRFLLWTRDPNFFKHYRGKPCIFGHTPTSYLPLLGRLGRHGIYVSHSAIGIDTGYNQQSPLTCLSLPDFTLFQAYSDGHTATHQITAFIPEELRAMQRMAAESDHALPTRISNAEPEV
jgi:serine/threonine protein phosphatase 1